MHIFVPQAEGHPDTTVTQDKSYRKRPQAGRLSGDVFRHRESPLSTTCRPVRAPVSGTLCENPERGGDVSRDQVICQESSNLAFAHDLGGRHSAEQGY